MVSTAIVMTMVADQTGSRPSSTDRLETDSGSFERSFDERIAGSTKVLEDDRPNKVIAGLQSLKNDPPMKTTNEVSSGLAQVKGRTAATSEGLGHIEVNPMIGGKTVPVPKVNVLGSQTETTLRGPELKGAPSLSDVEVAADGSSKPQDANGSSVSIEVSKQAASVGGSSLLPPDTEENSIRNEITANSVAPETGPIKNNVKSQQRKQSLAVSQKSKTSSHPLETALRSAPSNVSQYSDLASGNSVQTTKMSAFAVVIGSDGELSNGGDRSVSSGVSVAASSGATTTANDGLAKKDASVVKTDESGAGSAPIADENAESAKQSAGVERLLSGATSQGDNKDVLPVLESGSAAAVVHSIAGGSDFFSHVAGPSNLPGEANLTKPANGDVSGHTASLPAGLREQDGSVGAGGSEDGKPQMLVATPTAIEVGIQNGTHGWLKVRAEMTESGAVNASVSSSSTTGQEMLHRELPSLAAYLQSEKVEVNTVVVHPSVNDSRGLAESKYDGGAGQPQQGSSHGEANQKGASVSASNRLDEAANYDTFNIAEGGSPPVATLLNGGNWLSVRA